MFPQLEVYLLYYEYDYALLGVTLVLQKMQIQNLAAERAS